MALQTPSSTSRYQLFSQLYKICWFALRSAKANLMSGTFMEPGTPLTLVTRGMSCLPGTFIISVCECIQKILFAIWEKSP